MVLKVSVWVLGGHHPVTFFCACWPAPISILRIPTFLYIWGMLSVGQVIPDQLPIALSNCYLLLLRISNKNIF
jgi:hypothetical protein